MPGCRDLRQARGKLTKSGIGQKAEKPTCPYFIRWDGKLKETFRKDKEGCDEAINIFRCHFQWIQVK